MTTAVASPVLPAVAPDRITPADHVVGALADLVDLGGSTTAGVAAVLATHSVTGWCGDAAACVVVSWLAHALPRHVRDVVTDLAVCIDADTGGLVEWNEVTGAGLTGLTGRTTDLPDVVNHLALEFDRGEWPELVGAPTAQ